MSCTDYMKRVAINRPVVRDRQMRLPDASAYTDRVRLAATQIDRRHDHVINNSLDPGHVPNLFSKRVQNFSGAAVGGRNQDASSWTQSRGANAIGRDNFFAADGSRKQITNPGINGTTNCLTRPPPSQVVSEFGNSELSLAGLNMGYMATNDGITRRPNAVGVCTEEFNPQTKSYFVDTLPDIKLHKVGSAPQPATVQTAGGRQVVQNVINVRTTNTSGVLANQAKADVLYDAFSEPPHNPEKALFVTGIQGPQTGGGYTNGSRAPIVGGVSVKPKGSITHRGWGGRTRVPYPAQRVPPRGAPAQLKINDPNHYKI